MATNSAVLACQLADLKQLDNKPYIKFQTHLYDYDIEHLPGNSYRLKAKLSRLQKTDKRHNKGVVISQCRLAKLLGKSRETINRLLKQLEELGHIRITKNKYSKGLYNNQLCIEVVSPIEAYEYVRDNVLDITDSLRAPRGVTKISQGYDENITHSNNNRNYSGINLTNIRKESLTDNFEPVFDAVVLPRVVPCETSGVELEPVVGVVEPQAPNFNPVEFDTFKPQPEVARLITKVERTEAVKKIKAMRKAGEIHPKVQANYADIMVLVQHVIVHCMYRNVFKKTFKHALNSAAKGIRNGSWTIPKRIIAAETAERERLANEVKERERRLCLESGFGRILGHAIRLTHTPSEADIARLKADVLECGLNSLGQNASNENLAKLKDLIQKTVEDKQKERGK